MDLSMIGQEQRSMPVWVHLHFLRAMHLAVASNTFRIGSSHRSAATEQLPDPRVRMIHDKISQCIRAARSECTLSALRDLWRVLYSWYSDHIALADPPQPSELSMLTSHASQGTEHESPAPWLSFRHVRHPVTFGMIQPYGNGHNESASFNAARIAWC